MNGMNEWRNVSSKSIIPARQARSQAWEEIFLKMKSIGSIFHDENYLMKLYDEFMKNFQ